MNFVAASRNTFFISKTFSETPVFEPKYLVKIPYYKSMGGVYVSSEKVFAIYYIDILVLKIASKNSSWARIITEIFSTKAFLLLFCLILITTSLCDMSEISRYCWYHKKDSSKLQVVAMMMMGVKWLQLPVYIDDIKRYNIWWNYWVSKFLR